jgi:hypothetical protein
MTNNTTATTSKAKPSHTAYSVREYQKNGQKASSWTRIGAAFAHRDGEGFDLDLEAFPINGRIVIRKPKPKSAPQA